MKITIKQVARHAGVSPKTVSRVINEEIYVHEDTRQKVLNAIAELGYTANISAKRLSSGRSFTICLIFHNASWHYIQDVQRGVLETSVSAGYSMLLHPADFLSEHTIPDILRLVDQNQVDGFIFTPPADNSDTLIKELQKRDVPFVRLTPRERDLGLPYIAATDKKGAYDLTQYLINAGHTTIGFIHGPVEQRAAHDRYAGYLKALAEANIAPDTHLIAYGNDHYASGVRAANSLLQSNKNLSAIFCNNDEMAAGAISAVFDAGLHVPGDISVAGFDDIPLAQQVYPPLTTVRQPIYEIAQRATNVLIQLLNGTPVQHLALELPTELIIRKSTKQIK